MKLLLIIFFGSMAFVSQAQVNDENQTTRIVVQTPPLTLVARTKRFSLVARKLILTTDVNRYIARTPRLLLTVNKNTFSARAPALRLLTNTQRFIARTPALRLSADSKRFTARTPALRLSADSQRFTARTPRLRLLVDSQRYIVRTPPLRLEIEETNYSVRAPTLKLQVKSNLFAASAPKLRLQFAGQLAIDDDLPRRGDAVVKVDDTKYEKFPYAASRQGRFCPSLYQCRTKAEVRMAILEVRRAESPHETGFCGAVREFTNAFGECATAEVKRSHNYNFGGLFGFQNMLDCPALKRYQQELESAFNAGLETYQEEQLIGKTFDKHMGLIVAGDSVRACNEITKALNL